MTDSDCITTIPIEKSGYFSKLICDYLEKKPELKAYYNHYPDRAGLAAQIKERKAFQGKHHTDRPTLVNYLKHQYRNINITDKTQANIHSLSDENTFTVTTGHQLNIFTGPLYFLYKIISTINLTEQLQTEHPTYNFVPIYWMAAEDHDFNEINFFNFKSQIISWHTNHGGAVGRLQTSGLEKVLEVFEKALPKGTNGKVLIDLFRKSYLEHHTLAEATLYLVNELFGQYGLVILNADSSNLKRAFTAYAKNDVFKNKAYQKVLETNERLSKDYKIQVNPRKINLFYLTDGNRERIEENNGIYYVLNTEIAFTEKELKIELEKHPEKFSPNVILRPLYQEVILPNICYIGGGGELAYWLQLKSLFKTEKVPFPCLLLRNSAVIISEKQRRKTEKLNLKTEDLFLPQNILITKKTKEISAIEIDFSKQKKHLKKQFEDLYAIAEKTDKSFLGAVKAQETKQIKGLAHLEKRLLKAQKRKLTNQLDRIKILQDDLFPNQSLEERQRNFSEYYLAYGTDFIQMLKTVLDPLNAQFYCITMP
ncbi:MAG: bacillithiol biosynthesis cysteine-adding enzyme BshC [Flavobacteriales bacterium]|nr:MAG: bacillithiol biosynthesis cysteine-adding enzyme BshC [Flavobacteriales bacterium]